MGIITTQVPQDLHIHTIFSRLDSAVVKEQTPELIGHVRHARVIGISDHFEHFSDRFDHYKKALQKWGFHVGTEVDGAEYVDEASQLDFEYYIYHCRNRTREYQAIDRLLETGKPVIIPHPMVLETDLNRIPRECYVEINNRYVWRDDWKRKIGPHTESFRFVMGSDAHQPLWLNQNMARYVARKLGIEETLIFDH